MAVETTPCNFGWKASDFSLRGIDSKIYNLASVKGGKGTVIMFLCNHCPYVQAIVGRIVRDISELRQFGISAIAIMANDVLQYPEDSFEKMRDFSNRHNFPFPYVIDETQEVARIYGAMCTPDFFGFNQQLELQYRGRLDSARQGVDSSDTRRELFEAMLEIAKSGSGPTTQFPSVGCSIKWRDS